MAVSTPLTIIVPAKYEENNIISTLRSIQKQVRTPHKIIVVNDSYDDDETGSIAQNFAKKTNGIEVLIRRNGKKSTFASSLKAGFTSARSPFIIPVMADGCDRIGDIDKMYKKMHEGWDIVCASRYMKNGRKIGGPKMQSLCSFLVCATMQAFIGIPTSDISNAFKMYKRSLIRKLHVDPTVGVELSMAIALQAYFSGAKITQIPTVWMGRTTDFSKFRLLERTPRYLRLYIYALRERIKQIFA